MCFSTLADVEEAELGCCLLFVVIFTCDLIFTTPNLSLAATSNSPSHLDHATRTRDTHLDLTNNLQNSLPRLFNRPTLGRLHGTKRNRSRRNQRACSHDQRSACRTQPRGSRRIRRRRSMVLPHPLQTLRSLSWLQAQAHHRR